MATNNPTGLGSANVPSAAGHATQNNQSLQTQEGLTWDGTAQGATTHIGASGSVVDGIRGVPTNNPVVWPNFESQSSSIIGSIENQLYKQGLDTNLWSATEFPGLNRDDINSRLGISEAWQRNDILTDVNSQRIELALEKNPSYKLIDHKNSLKRTLKKYGVSEQNFNSAREFDDLVEQIAKTLGADGRKFKSKGASAQISLVVTPTFGVTNATQAVNAQATGIHVRYGFNEAIGYGKNKTFVPATREFQVNLADSNRMVTNNLGLKNQALTMIGPGGQHRSAAGELLFFGRMSLSTGDIRVPKEVRIKGIQSMSLKRARSEISSWMSANEKNSSYRAMADVNEKLGFLMSEVGPDITYGEASRMFGSKIALSQARNYVPGVSTYKDADDIYNKIIGMQQTVAEHNAWAGGEGTKTAIYNSVNAAEIARGPYRSTFSIFGMKDSYAARMHMQASYSGDSPFGKGVLQIPGIRHSGPSFDLRWNPANMRVMDIAKRRQMIRDEVAIAPATSHHYAGRISYDDFGTGPVGQSPFIRLRTYTGEEAATQRAIREYARLSGKSHLASIALTEDTAIAASELFSGPNALRLSKGVGHDFLNIKGLGGPSFGGRNLMSATTHQAAMLLGLDDASAKLLTENISRRAGAGASLITSISEYVQSGAFRDPFMKKYGGTGGLSRFQNELRDAMTTMIRSTADSKNRAFLGWHGEVVKGQHVGVRKYIDDVSNFSFMDVTFSGKSTDSWAKLVGMQEMGVSSSTAKFLSSLKATANRNVSRADLSGIAALSEMIRRQGGGLDFNVSDQMFKEAMALAQTEGFSSLNLISPEGSAAGGMAKGLADFSAAKDIKRGAKLEMGPTGFERSKTSFYEYLDLNKSTRLAEELDAMANLVATMTSKGMSKDEIKDLSANLEKMGFGLNIDSAGNFQVKSLGGTKDVARIAAKKAKGGKLTIEELAAVSTQGYERMSFEQRAYATATYIEAQMRNYSAKDKSFYYSARNIDEIRMDPTKLEEFRARAFAAGEMEWDNRFLNLVNTSNVDGAFAKRNPVINKIADLLMQRESVGAVKAGLEVQKTLAKYNFGGIYDTTYMVVDEAKNLEDTLRIRSEKNQEIYYRSRKGLLTKEQKELEALFKKQIMPTNIQEKFRYLYSMLDPTVHADKDIKLQEMVDVLKFQNLREDQRNILAAVMKSQSTEYSTVKKTAEEYFNDFVSKYGISNTVGPDTLAENRTRVSAFFKDVVFNPNKDLRGQFLDKFFGGRSTLSLDVTQAAEKETRDIFQDFFLRGTNQIGVTIGDKAYSEAFLKQYGSMFKSEQAGQSAFIALKRMNLSPEAYGFKENQYKVGRGGVGSFEQDEFQRIIGEIFEDISGTKYDIDAAKTIALTPAERQGWKASQASKAFGYAFGSITSAGGGEEIMAGLGMDYVGFRGRAQATGISENMIDMAKSQGMYSSPSVLVDQDLYITALEKSYFLEHERQTGKRVSEINDLLFDLKEELNKRKKSFTEGAGDIIQGTRGPLNTESRQMFELAFSANYYGANLPREVIGVFKATENSAEARAQNKLYELTLAKKNLDFDGDQKTVRMFAGKELVGSASSYQRMEAAAMQRTASFMQDTQAITASTKSFADLYSDVLSSVRSAAPDAAADVQRQVAFSTLSRVGMIGGRKAIGKVKGVTAEAVNDDTAKYLMSYLGDETGSATNMYNTYSTYLKANSKRFKAGLSRQLGVEVTDSEVYSMFDLVNEQIAEAFANIKNYHDPSGLLKLHEEMKTSYKAGDFLGGFNKYLDLTRQAFEPMLDPTIAQQTGNFGHRINNEMLQFFFSDAEDAVKSVAETHISSHLKSYFDTAKGEMVGPGFIRANKGSKEIINATEFVEMMSGGDINSLATLVQKTEKDIGMKFTEGKMVQSALAQGVLSPAYANTLASVGATQARSLNAPMAAAQSAAAAVVENASQTQQAAHMGGSIVNEVMSSGIEDSLIKAIEANKHGLGRMMAIGGAVGAGLMIGAGAIAAVRNRVSGESIDRDAQRTFASQSREDAMADQVSYQSPVMVEEGVGGYNYNKVSRKINFSSMFGISNTDIMRGAGSRSVINVTNTVDRSTIDAALGKNYGQDSY